MIFLIFCPAAPPFLLKIVISCVEWWSSCCINFDLSGTVVMRVNSASTYRHLTKYKNINTIQVKENNNQITGPTRCYCDFLSWKFCPMITYYVDHTKLMQYRNTIRILVIFPKSYHFHRYDSVAQFQWPPHACSTTHLTQCFSGQLHHMNKDSSPYIE